MESNNTLLMAGSVIIAGLLIAGAVFWNGQHPGSGTAGSAGTGAAPSVNIANIKTDGSPFIGDPNAPVTVAFWSDFQCPFCKMFEVQTLPQIVQNYVNAGKVKVVFMDFPFLGPDSTVDGEYARAVWALYPSQYFAWRSALFTDQPQENSLNAADNLAWLKKVSNSVSGIEFAKLTAEVAANQATYDAAMNADKAQGTANGINATPSFIIGTQLISGAEPYAAFQQALDAALAK
jgi:protein-disulfide isomerase